jgi:hypothetical protein
MSKRFEAAFVLDGQSSELNVALLSESPEQVEGWMNKVLLKELDDMSVRELRIRAARLQIPFYTTFGKSALILKIIEVQEENARKAQQTAVDLPLPQADYHPQGAGEYGRELPCGAGVGGTGNSTAQD